MVSDPQDDKTAHCPTCTCGKRANVQRSRKLNKGDGTIAWWEHLDAYAVYSAQYGSEQSAQRIHERAGFSYSELIMFLGHEPTTWSPR